MHRFVLLGRGYPRLTALIAGLVAAVVASAVYIGSAPATEAQSAAKGATVYTNNCQICHGVNGQGHYGPPLIPRSPAFLQLPREQRVRGLTGLLRNGISGYMPRFTPEQLNDDDIGALADWIFEASSNAPQGRRFIAAMAKVGPVADTANQRYFPETGHTLAGSFKRFWEANGGVRIFGYPISEEYLGYDNDGKPVTMQLFERARFEYRPEMAAITGSDVQLGNVGSDDASERIYFLTRRGRTP